MNAGERSETGAERPSPRNGATASGAAVALIPSQRFGDDVAGGHDSVNDPLCVFYPLSDSQGALIGGAFPCWTAAGISAGRAVQEAASEPASLHLFGLVPDGVANVTARFDDGSTAHGQVNNNFFDMPLNRKDSVGLADMTWTSRAGQIIGPPPRRPRTRTARVEVPAHQGSPALRSAAVGERDLEFLTQAEPADRHRR